MEIRVISDGEINDALYLSSQAFAHGARDLSYALHPDRPTRIQYGVYDEQGLQAKVAVLDYRIHLGDQICRMGGVGGVASLPASRGKGYASKCMKHALGQMREAGQFVSSLFPFSYPFYRKLGYEWTGVSRLYSVAAESLPADPGVEQVRAVKVIDRPLVERVYSAYATRYRGMIARDEKHWRTVLDDSEAKFTYSYLYESESGPEGYLVMRDGIQDKTELREFVCLTHRAHKALLALLRRHAMHVKTFTWYAPDNDPLWHFQPDLKFETKLEPVCQSRVVDVEASLRFWQPKEELSVDPFTLRVLDPVCEWNQKNFTVEARSGVITADPTGNQPDLTISIQSFTQAYFGTPFVDGYEEHVAGSLSRLRSVLDGPPMYISDDF